MIFSETSRLIERAEHLLWVLARHDVEELEEQRHYVLERLCDLEKRAIDLGVTDLYQAVLQNADRRLLQSSYDDG
jgi:hypothetical protein